MALFSLPCSPRTHPRLLSHESALLMGCIPAYSRGQKFRPLYWPLLTRYSLQLAVAAAARARGCLPSQIDTAADLRCGWICGPAHPSWSPPRETVARRRFFIWCELLHFRKLDGHRIPAQSRGLGRARAYLGLDDCLARELLPPARVRKRFYASRPGSSSPAPSRGAMLRIAELAATRVGRVTPSVCGCSSDLCSCFRARLGGTVRW